MMAPDELWAAGLLIILLGGGLGIVVTVIAMVIDLINRRKP